MKKFRIIMWAACLMLGLTTIQARPAKGQKKAKTERNLLKRPLRVAQGTVYMFAYSTSMKDSTVFLTPIQRVDSVFIEKHTGFLMDRHLYSMQFQAYLEDSLHLTNMTTAVLFSTKQKKAAKRRAKVVKHAKADTTLRLTELDAAAFSFYAEKWIDTTVTDEEEKPQATAESPKKKKKK